MVIVFSWGLQNFYGSLHGGSLVAVCEMVSIACARTVVVLYEDEADVRSQLVLFYQGLYEETEVRRPTMDGLDFTCIGEEERLSLEKEFSKEEVIQVL